VSKKIPGSIYTQSGITENLTGAHRNMHAYTLHSYQAITDSGGFTLKVEISMDESNWTEIASHACGSSSSIAFSDTFCFNFVRFKVTDYSSGNVTVIERHDSQ